MQYEVNVRTTKSDMLKVEAVTLDEALEKARNGQGVSMNEGEVSVSVCGRPMSATATGMACAETTSVSA